MWFAGRLLFGLPPREVMDAQAALQVTNARFAIFAEKFEDGPEFNLHETHFDHITQPAPSMTVLGYSENTPVQMCCVGDHFLGEGPCPASVSTTGATRIMHFRCD